MKKSITACFYLTLTSIVITAIFFLPSVLFWYQDQQMSAKIEQTEIKSMEFTYSNSLFDTLKLLSSGYYTVEYPSGEGTHTVEEIREIASKAFRQLFVYGKKYGISLLDEKDKFIDYEISLQLAISDNYETDSTSGSESKSGMADASGSKPGAQDGTDARGITSAVVWQCYMTSEYRNPALFLIDDKSGKIASVFFWNVSEALGTGSSFWPADAALKTVRRFLRRHYGLEVKTVPAYNKYTYNSDAKEAGRYRASYTIRLTDEFGTHVQIPLIIRPDIISLNAS